jgi:signal transduction histidine kinase
MAGKESRPSREQTDRRLTVERAKTDEEIARRTQAAAVQADEVTNAARRRAADVLESARGRADARMRAGNGSDAEQRHVAEERSQEDDVLRDEYAAADRVAADERAERARLVAELLRQEREDTDTSLLLERVDADTILSKRDEFLGMVSHDLRNELSGIALSVGQILGNLGDDEAGRKVFRSATNIQRINLRMSRLIGDLLDIVSINVGKFRVVPEDHDVSRTLDDILESFAPIASAKGISLTVERIDESLAACFDRHRVQQVLGNLLTNALKYTSDRGRVSVGAERKGAEVWFVVADSGAGIDPDRLGTIFDRFAQGARPDRKGLGLGLYIARRIVEAHGGRIWAESQPGHGSTFYFALPIRGGERPSQHAELHPPTA